MQRSASIAVMIVLLLSGSMAFAQNLPDQYVGEATSRISAVRKCDPWLRAQLLEWERSATLRAADSVASGSDAMRISAPVVGIFVSGNISSLPDVIRSNGGTVGTLLSTMATVRIPIDRVITLAGHHDVMRLELAQPVELDNDTARILIGADAVHRGDLPLVQGYTGKGIIVGFIDTGIDFWHPEFRRRDDTAKSRILAVWSQVDSGGNRPLPPLDYGVEWSGSEINDEIDGTPTGGVTHRDLYGHGTHVAGTAAGRNGVAPDVDIIMVQFHNQFVTLTTDVLDGAAYIYRKAQELGRPCVINASLSTHLQYHDANDPVARGLDELLSESPGRFFCASMGNRGKVMGHWGDLEAEPDSLWTYAQAGDLYLRVADSVASEFEYSIIIDSTRPGGGPPLKIFGQTPWRSITAIEVSGGTVDQIPCGTRTLNLTSTASPLGNNHIGLLVTPGTQIGASGCGFRVMVRGRGHFHSWSTTSFRITPEYPTNNRFRRADSLYSGGSPAHARQVIAVGSYVNRSSYLADDGIYYPKPPARGGDLSDFSSRGPMLDGSIKPDISAPGENVVSARSQYYKYSPADHKLTDTTFRVLSGTSMSSPMVAGGVALYLERHPTATIDDVRRAITLSALHDDFTLPYGAEPNGFWGYGKLNLWSALAIPPGISGVDRQEHAPEAALSVHPNPSQGEIMIHYHRTHPGNGTLLLYNELGEIIMNHALPERSAGKHFETIDLSTISPGIYIIKLTTPSTVTFSRITILR